MQAWEGAKVLTEVHRPLRWSVLVTGNLHFIAVSNRQTDIQDADKAVSGNGSAKRFR